jgi:hypothetical protein
VLLTHAVSACHSDCILSGREVCEHIGRPARITTPYPDAWQPGGQTLGSAEKSSERAGGREVAGLQPSGQLVIVKVIGGGGSHDLAVYALARNVLEM